MLVNGSPGPSQFVLDTVTPTDYISTTSTNNSELSLANPTLLENGRLTLPTINCRKDEAEVTEDIAIHGGTLRINIDNSAVRRGACEKRRRVPKVGLGRGNGCRSVLAYPVRPSRTVVRELGTVDIELEIGGTWG